MKKIVVILTMIFAFTFQSKAQTVDSTGIKDSVEITLSIQARDVEYITGFIYNNDFYENLVDSIKPAYRKLINPSSSTPVVIKGYTKDFIEVVKMLRNDVCAIKNNIDTRLLTLLSLLNVPYINAKLTGFTDADNSQFTYGRSAGKWRLVKKK
jgi:hypothetical protein